MNINTNAGQNLPVVNLKKTGNSGNGVGNTGPGNQGNDKVVGNAGGNKLKDVSTFENGRLVIPASDTRTYSADLNTIRQNRNIQALRNFGVQGQEKGLQSLTGEGFSIDIGVDYQVSQTQGLYNGIVENNIKISIDANLQGKFDSFKLDVAIENNQASGFQNINIDLSLQMLRQTAPDLLNGFSQNNFGEITPQRTGELLNLDLDINIQTSGITKSSTERNDFYNKLSEQTSENIFQFAKSRLQLAMLGETDLTQEKIDDFFEIIKKAIQEGYDAARGELGEMPDKMSDSLELTLELTFQKLDSYHSEVQA